MVVSAQNRTWLLVVVLLLTALFFFRGLIAGQSKDSTQPKFSVISAEDASKLDKQRAVIAAAAKKRFGSSSLTKQKGDLVVLQKLIDDHVFDRTQTYELQCLGVAFGDVLASEYPLKWVMVTDEYGTDPTLRYKETAIQINALTMIAKRIERNERVNLTDLLRITGEQLVLYEKKCK